MTPPISVGNAIESLANLVYLMQRETDLEKMHHYINMMDSAVQMLVQDLGFAHTERE